MNVPSGTATVPIRSSERRLPAEQRRAVIEAAASEVFGERGYHGASLDEIARRSGVSVPVVYDHFASKRSLFVHLLARHYAELRAIWADRATGPLGHWFPGAVDAWFAYVEDHRFAGRLLFQDTTGDPEIAAAHRAIREDSRDRLLPMTEAALPAFADRPWAVELAWEALRATMQGLAVWWYDHAEVPRPVVVEAALRAMWTGLERSVPTEMG